MANQYPLTTLSNLKNYLKVTDSTNDIFLQTIIDRASEDFESDIDRKIRSREYTEYHSGDGKSNKLFLKQYPIVSVSSLYDDPNRNYTSTHLISSSDYVINYDSGIIELDGLVFSSGKNNIKVVYTAGYDDFVVIEGYNDKIDFNEGDSELTATLSSGKYTANELCTEIVKQLEAVGDGEYTAVYNPFTAKFTISKSAGTFQILWNSGSNSSNNCALLLGYSTNADDKSSLVYTSDNSVIGIPNDIELAVILLSIHYFKMSNVGGARQGIASESVSAGSFSYISDKPVEYKQIVEKYKRKLI